MSEAYLKNDNIFFLRINNSHLPKRFEVFLEELKARTQESRIRERQERFKLIKNNTNLNNFGEPPEYLDNDRSSPFIEEVSSQLTSINTSLLIKMVDQKW